MYNPNQVSNLVPFVEQRPVKNNRTRMFQEGGEAPMPEQAPQEQGGSPEEMAQGIVEQILQSVQDTNVIAMIAQMLMEAVQGGQEQGGEEMLQEQPAMRNGGVLNLKFAKGGLTAKMKKDKMKTGGKAC